jgi:Single-stranded DNA-binding protein
MAGSLNKVLLIGRLGADPEIKQNGKWKKCCKT